MCTVSWLIAPASSPSDGESGAEGGEGAGVGAGSRYTLWFNRDERHTRAAEGAPGEWVGATGGRYLAPVDGERGGTWLAVNEHGLTVALLNDYVTPWQPSVAGQSEGEGNGAKRPSRGQLVRDLAEMRSLSELTAAMERRDLSALPPFHLLGLAPGATAPAGWHWNGSTLRASAVEELTPPWSSSSFESAPVIAARRAVYASAGPDDAAAHRLYHVSGDAERGAFGVNMRRPDAATRSICEVGVTREAVTLEYLPQAWPGAPRAESGPVVLRLPRCAGGR